MELIRLDSTSQIVSGQVRAGRAKFANDCLKNKYFNLFCKGACAESNRV